MAGTSIGTVKIIQLALRAVIWFCAMIAFASTADVQDYDFYGGFRFVVGVGVLVWLLQAAIAGFMVMAFYMTIVPQSMSLLVTLIIIGVDAFFGFLSFCAFIASAVEINKCRSYSSVGRGTYACYSLSDMGAGTHEVSNLNAGAAFMFFCWILLMVAAGATFILRTKLAEQPPPDSDPAPYQDAAALDYSIEQL
jgi:hypothetical protein